MLSQSKSRVVIPLMLLGFLFFGAVSAEAYDHRGKDRVAKGAVVGAVVGTLFQIFQGRTEGHEILQGAVVGGTLGAAAGAYREERDRYDRYSRDEYYDEDGYTDEDGYAVEDGYAYWDADYDRYDQGGDSRGGYYLDRSYDDHDRHEHRHGKRCGHR